MSNQNFRSPPVNVVHQNESQFHRPKGSGPNPLGCPPSLGHNQHQIPNNSQIQPILSNNSVPAGLAFNDLMQQPPNIRTGPPSATPQGPQIGYAANQQSSHFVNNLQGQLLSSLASQLMSQRSVMMNYDLSGNIPLLSRFGQHNHQNFQAGSNQSIVCLMDEKRASQGQDDLHQQNDSRQPDFTRIPCQARGMSTDHNALVSDVVFIPGCTRRNPSNATAFFLHSLLTWKSQLMLSTGCISCVPILLVALLE